MKNVIVLPTYNEIENIEAIVTAVFGAVPDVYVTVVDDNSPDGTGKLVQKMMAKYPRLSLITREKKAGLGKAYIHAFNKLLEDRDVRTIVTMDADLSHPVSVLPEMFKHSYDYPLVIGSRYVKGGNIVGWELRRKVLSFFGNIYCRTITRLPIKDCTGGFNVMRMDHLRRVPLDVMDSSGYAFLMELKYLLVNSGASVKEVPITFTNRVGGESKITSHIVREGVIAPWKMSYGQYERIFKYIISGGTAAAVDIGFLFLFTDVFKLWYLFSAILAFLLAFGISFFLQKFWTFKDRSMEGVHVQAAAYLGVSLVNLGLNTLLMYIFVDLAHIWYVLAQVLTGGLIAIGSYFIYRKFIFKT